jgi:two-component system sensor histidine kinase PilS (NtrC family)
MARRPATDADVERDPPGADLDPGFVVGAPQPTASLSRSLGWFSLARLVVAAVLILYVPLVRTPSGAAEPSRGELFVSVAVLYLAAAAAFLWLSRPGRVPLRLLAFVQVAVDIVLLVVLIHAAGGARSGLTVLLILPNAGAAILLGTRIGLFFSAMTSVLLLLETGWTWLAAEPVEAGFAQAGLAGAALLSITLTVGGLAARLSSQERLALRRGEDLRNQLAVTQAVIGELPNGVVVLGPRGEPRAINRSAREMLGGPTLPGLPMLRASLGLKAGVGDAPAQSATDVAEFEVVTEGARSEHRVRARRVDVAGRGSDLVVVLEDLGRLEERAQQLKLASMGRLSASIAHEIRNPLSAIRHANGLLAEQLGTARLERLATIVEDNCRRIDRIVEDVLSISRRGSATPEALAPGPFLVQVVSELIAQSGADPRRIECHVRSDEAIWFDADNLRRILTNLLANALRHGSDRPGAIALAWEAGEGGRPVLVVADDGPGVPPESRQHLFEPFFTTGSRGTGLGLHLARELCNANGATIRYQAPGDNPPRRSGFVVEPAPPPPR